MELKNNIIEAIGNTPIVKLNHIPRDLPGELYAKCEFTNPGGSIKDRIGMYLIEAAEKAGKIKPGGTIVEATSGNTGMGLAIAAAIKGYQSVFVMPDKMSEEKRQNLRAFGAKVVITPTGVPADSPNSHYSVAARIARETPNAFFTNQYNNLANRQTHYLTTGPEILRQCDGQLDAIVMGMGTCGTITGIGKFFKEKKPSVKIIGVDPKGSILKDLFETGKHGPAASYKVEGIGEDIVPDNLDFKVIDQIVQTDDKESYLMTRTLLTKEGIFTGPSAGAAVCGALKYMASTAKPGRVIVILPDSGNRYMSKAFNDAWMIENGFLTKPITTTVSDLLKAQNKQAKVICAELTDRVEAAITIMRKEGVSQLPVLNRGKIVGVLQETALLRPLLSQAVKPTDTIERLVDTNYSLVQETDGIERLHEILSKHQVALVEEQDKVKYILTKIDLISFLSNQTSNK